MAGEQAYKNVRGYQYHYHTTRYSPWRQCHRDKASVLRLPLAEPVVIIAGWMDGCWVFIDVGLSVHKSKFSFCLCGRSIP